MGPFAISYADVQAAAGRLRNVAHRTPVLTSRHIDELTGARVHFKAENLQRTGSFKFRGAYNTLSRFTAEQRERGAITYSSGNHAQAIALAARELQMPSVLVMPGDAPAAKMAAARDYQRGLPGSEIVLYDRKTQDRAAICARLAAERGMTMVPPYDHPDVMAGQGTVAFELIGQVGPLDALLVCLGGGGLLSGCSVAAHYLLPEIAIYGVEPAAGNDVQQSMAVGHIVKIHVPQTIADGAQTTACGELTFPVIRQLVREVVTVTDDELVDTMRVLAQRIKQVVEPTGCLAAAALLTRKIDLRGLRVGVVLSGGNVDLPHYARYLQGL